MIATPPEQMEICEGYIDVDIPCRLNPNPKTCPHFIICGQHNALEWNKKYNKKWKPVLTEEEKILLKIKHNKERSQRQKEYYKNHPEFREKISKISKESGWYPSHKGCSHSEETKRKISENNKGKHSDMENIERLRRLGKIYKNKGGYHLSEKTKEKMRKAIRKFPNKPTKPEVKLFEVIKSRYPNEEVMSNHRVKTQDGNRFIDVAIPVLMLGWEFDGKYWHKDKKEADQRRHEAIEAEGWKLTHYSNESEFPKIDTPTTLPQE